MSSLQFHGDGDGGALGGEELMARAIAESGRAWSLSHWRREDMTAYMVGRRPPVPAIGVAAADPVWLCSTVSTLSGLGSSPTTARRWTLCWTARPQAGRSDFRNCRSSHLDFPYRPFGPLSVPVLLLLSDHLCATSRLGRGLANSRSRRPAGVLREASGDSQAVA
jgi:hypothetical protein